jgi:hypothetical protein
MLLEPRGLRNVNLPFRTPPECLALVLLACGGSTPDAETASDGGGASSESSVAPGSGGAGGGLAGDDGSIGAGGSTAAGGSVAAGGSISTGTGGTLVGSGGSIGADGSTMIADAGRCNTLVNSAPVVNTVVVADMMPPAMGGTPVSGTYHLTSWTGYGTEANCRAGLSVTQGQSVVVVKAASATTGTIEEVITVHLSSGLSINDEHDDVTYTTSGSTMTTTITCASGGSASGRPSSYTATPTEIWSYSTTNPLCPTIAVATRQ